MQVDTQAEITEIPTNKTDKIIRRGVIFSLVAHAVVLSGFVIQSTFFSAPEAIDYESAVRVDIMGMPEKYTPEDFNTKPAPPVEEVKPLPKPEPVKEPPKKEPPKPKEETINLNKNSKKKQQQALDKLKAQSAIDKIKESLSKEKKPGKQIKGNAISPGTELTGLDKLVHNNYANELNRHVKQYWALPEWLRNQPLKALIKVRIDARGNILSKEIIKTSGNKSFDENALGTVEQSAPFPAPPEKLTDLVRIDGILIGFPE